MLKALGQACCDFCKYYGSFRDCREGFQSKKFSSVFLPYPLVPSHLTAHPISPHTTSPGPIMWNFSILAELALSKNRSLTDNAQAKELKEFSYYLL